MGTELVDTQSGNGPAGTAGKEMPASLHREIWDALGDASEMATADLEGALELVERMQRRVEEWNEVGLMAGVKVYKTYIYRFAGREEESNTCFRESNEMIPLITNQYDLMRVMNGVAMEHIRRDNPVRGLELLKRSEEILHSMDEPYWLRGNYHSQTIAFFKLGVFEEALEYNLRTARLTEELSNTPGAVSPGAIFKVLINTGSVYGKLQDYAKGEETYQRAIAMIRSGELNDDYSLAICGINLGALHNLTGRYREAIPYLHEAADIFIRHHDIMLSSECLGELGVASLHLDDVDGAAGYFRRAWELCEGAMVTGVTPAVILRGMGQVHQRRGELAGALDQYLRSLAICQEMALAEEEMEAHVLLAGLYPLLDDYRNAYDHQKRAMELRQQILGAEQQRAAAAAELRNERIAAEREREKLNLRAEKAEYEAEFKTKELSMMALQMTQWNAAFRSLRQSVEPYARDGRGQTKAVASSVLKDITTAVESNPGWRVFEEQFERVHGEFIGRLRARSSRLTSTELRICVLIRMGLSTPQIADALYSSELTIKKHRTNIRKKLELHGDENLNGLLLSL